MRVHLIGVSGTGMGSLALLLREAGHEVTGSDVAFDPPTGPALHAAGIVCHVGYDPAHLDSAPDLVVVGNAIRRENPEAAAARERGLVCASMSGALREHFLRGRRPLIVAGTHGKTTTSAMCAWLLARAGLEPGYFIGGAPKNFPSGAALGRMKSSLNRGRAPFVVEGDEYDAVYWNKKPKFLDYAGVGPDDVAIITSVEHDHVDIYPDPTSYDAAFRALLERVPEGGLVACDAKCERARNLIVSHARCRTVFYALEGDRTGDVTPTWVGAPSTFDERGLQRFDLYAGGISCGRFAMASPGAHNVRNAVAALAACAEGFGISIADARGSFATFEGVRRRQDLIGQPSGIRVYDDFAHHPTAVDETLRALRARHPEGVLWAIFEPRSATACRSVHHEAYREAFGAAGRVVLAPLGRSNIPEAERLDVFRLARELGTHAEAAATVDAIVETVARDAKTGDTIALLSNGAFSGLHARMIQAIEQR